MRAAIDLDLTDYVAIIIGGGGILGVDPNNHLVAMVRDFSGRGRIAFVHLRHIRTNAAGDFNEVAHLSSAGVVDITRRPAGGSSQPLLRSSDGQ